MQTRSQHRRRTVVAALLLVLQFAVAAAVPMADAMLEAAARDGYAHLEGQGSAPCPPGHDHVFCQFCRFTAPNVLPAAGVESATDGHVERRIAAPHFRLVPRSLHPTGSLGARSPPLV